MTLVTCSGGLLAELDPLMIYKKLL